MTENFGGFNPFETEENSSEEGDNGLLEINEEEQKEAEIVDREKLDEIEDEYKDLNKELLDIEDEDAGWLIKRVGLGILKIALAVLVLGFLLWAIWGNSKQDNPENLVSNIKVEKTSSKSSTKYNQKDSNTKNRENPVLGIEKFAKKQDSGEKQTQKTKNKGFWARLFSRKPKSSTTKDNQAEIPAVTEQKTNQNRPNNSEQVAYINSTASLSVMAWNYWVEQNRLVGQKDTPGEVILWKKKTEALFEIPFSKQVEGNNDTERQNKFNYLYNQTEDLLKQAEIHQTNLQQEIAEYSAKEKMYIAEATAEERKFLNAMNNSDPSGIDKFLQAKIKAEKLQTENGIEAESRKILSEKVEGYSQILINLREYLTANQKSLVKDVQVVQFPEDPFNRIIPLKSWEQNRDN